jgi:hypothetical protein
MSLRSHDTDVAPGAGHPRLVQARQGHAPVGSPAAEGIEHSYPLSAEVTSLGSSPSSDIVLAGIEADHGQVRREEAGDEFVYHQITRDGQSHVNGVVVTDIALHHGDRLSVGEWTLIYQRDEFADHGRFDGGRQGGEASGTRVAGSGGQESEPSAAGPIQ